MKYALGCALVLAALGCAANTSDDLGGRAEAVVGSESTVRSVVAVASFSASGNDFCSGVAIGPREFVTGRVCVESVLDHCSGVAIFADSLVALRRDPDFVAAEVLMQDPEDAEYPLAVLRTSAPHGIPALTLASAAPAVDDIVTLVGMGADSETTGSGTRREASAAVVEYPAGPEGVFSTAPGASCRGDMGGAVIAADGLTLLGVMFAGAGSTCFGGGDGVDLHAEVFTHRAFLEAAIAADPPEACPGRVPVDSGTEVDSGVEADAGAGSDGGTEADTGPTPDAGTPPASDDGCGCTTVGQHRDLPAAPLFALFAVVLRFRRRRRRSRRPGRTPPVASFSLLLLLLLALALAACNDGDGASTDAATDSSSGGECGDLGTCFAPSICVEGDAGEPTCSLDHLGAPTCAAIPEELAGAISVLGDDPLHWYPPEDCIPVTYEAALEDAVPAITAAVATHQAVACNRLCLGAIASSETPVAINRGERRIHFRLGTADEAITDRVVITQWFYGRTYMLLSGEIIVRSDVAGALTESEALGGLVRASGMSSSASPSVINQPPDGLAELTDLDEAALCFLYGDPPACTYEP